MLTKFWDKSAEGIAGELLSRILTPALAFWGIGLVLWVQRIGGWEAFRQRVTTIDPLGIAWIVAVIFLLAVSVGLMNWLTLPVLKILEGYWVKPFKGLRFALSERVKGRIDRKREQAKALRDRKRTLTARQCEQLAVLEQEILLAYPRDADLVMLTRLGNLLRAAEEYSLRYGLEMTTTLARLWLVLPEGVQKELNSARRALDERVRLVAWGGLLVVWVFFAPNGWWVAGLLLAAALVVVASYYFCLDAASTYAQLLRAAYDLYRFDLYRQLEWPLPPTPAMEEAAGKKLNQHLYRFANFTKVYFTHDVKK